MSETIIPSSNPLNPQDLAQYIEHTLLRPEASRAEIETLCSEAKEYRFKGVCVEAKWLPVVTELLNHTPVLAVTVIGFPSGTVSTEQKAREAKAAREQGADEIDMVLNREWLKAKKFEAVYLDIKAVVTAAEKVPVKVIFETSELTHGEKVMACALSRAAGALFVKTSTGFSGGGATVEDVKLMRETVGTGCGVKASGGVRNREQAIAMVKAGADRLGTSAGVAIVKGTSSGGGY